MTHLVMRDDLALSGIEDAALLLQARDDALHRDGEVRERTRVGAAPGGDQSRLVDEVGEIGAGEPRRERRDLIQIGVLRQADLAYVHLEDLRAALPVRTVDEHLAIEAPRAQKRRIEDLRAIGCGEQDESLARIEAIHLDQELIQRLLLLIVPAHAVRAT